MTTNAFFVRILLLHRLAGYKRRPTAEKLAASLTVERFPTPKSSILYRGMVAFRHLRQDARVAAARRVLEEET